MFDGQVSARDLLRQQAGWCRIGARMRVPRPTGAMRPLWAIRARASQLGRSAPCTRETTASDTRNLSSSKSCGSEAAHTRSVRPQSMSTRRSAALWQRTCSPSRALQDCCGDHPQPMQTEAARARARSTTRAHCDLQYRVKYPRRSYRPTPAAEAPPTVGGKRANRRREDARCAKVVPKAEVFTGSTQEERLFPDFRAFPARASHERGCPAAQVRADKRDPRITLASQIKARALACAGATDEHSSKRAKTTDPMALTAPLLVKRCEPSCHDQALIKLG